MPTILISGCAILSKDRLLLIKKQNKDFWELPGGIVENKTDLELAAAHKTKNQIGIEPSIIQQFTTLEFQIDNKNMEADIFECDVDPDSTFTPGENINDVKWFNISEVGSENIGEDVKAILDEL